VTNEPGLDVQVQPFKKVGFETLDGDRTHDGIIGAILKRRNVKLDLIRCALLGKLIPQNSVCCHAPADTKDLQSASSDGLN